jgi:hypothetical protein
MIILCNWGSGLEAASARAPYVVVPLSSLGLP